MEAYIIAKIKDFQELSHRTFFRAPLQTPPLYPLEYNCIFHNGGGVLGQGPLKLALLCGNNSNELFASNEKCQREVSEKPCGRIETYFSNNSFNSLHWHQPE